MTDGIPASKSTKGYKIPRILSEATQERKIAAPIPTIIAIAKARKETYNVAMMKLKIPNYTSPV